MRPISRVWLKILCSIKIWILKWIPLTSGKSSEDLVGALKKLTLHNGQARTSMNSILSLSKPVALCLPFLKATVRISLKLKSTLKLTKTSRTIHPYQRKILHCRTKTLKIRTLETSWIKDLGPKIIPKVSKLRTQMTELAKPWKLLLKLLIRVRLIS